MKGAPTRVAPAARAGCAACCDELLTEDRAARGSERARRARGAEPQGTTSTDGRSEGSGTPSSTSTSRCHPAARCGDSRRPRSKEFPPTAGHEQENDPQATAPFRPTARRGPGSARVLDRIVSSSRSRKRIVANRRERKRELRTAPPDVRPPPILRARQRGFEEQSTATEGHWPATDAIGLPPLGAELADLGDESDGGGEVSPALAAPSSSRSRIRELVRARGARGRDHDRAMSSPSRAIVCRSGFAAGVVEIRRRLVQQHEGDPFPFRTRASAARRRSPAEVSRQDDPYLRRRPSRSAPSIPRVVTAAEAHENSRFSRAVSRAAASAGGR